MPVDTESLKRVLLNIKGAAKGFRKDKLSSRLKKEELDPTEGDTPLDPISLQPEVSDAEPDVDPNEPASEENGMADEGPPTGAPLTEADKKLAAIRKLIGSV